MRHLFLCVLVVSIMGVQAYAEPRRCEESLHIATYNAVLDTYKEDHNKLQSSLQQWQGTATFLLYLTIAVALFGGCVSVLQAVYDYSWKKIIIVGLGVLIALVTVLKDNLPEGNYKSYQQAITNANDLDSDLNRYFRLANQQALPSENVKIYIGEICKTIDKWRELNVKYSTTLPSFFISMVATSHASAKRRTWISKPPQNNMVFQGTGSSLSEAKRDAESKVIQQIDLIKQSITNTALQKPIYRDLKEDLLDSIIKLGVLQREIFFDDSTPVSYWILYEIDKKRIDKLLNDIVFPFTIFKTNMIADRVEALSTALSDYGFTVSEAPAPRGPNSETNAIFIGAGVPVDAIKALVYQIDAQDIPLKGIIYPWSFLRSNLPQVQKLNHVQLGGTDYLEAWPRLSREELDKLGNIASKEDLIAFSKKYTDKLREAFGLQD